MGEYIRYEESPSNKGKYILALCHNNLPFSSGTLGSYNILLARIAGLSYANFLRMCRDIYGAQVIGKNSKYPVAYFSSKEKIEDLAKWLDSRVRTIMEDCVQCL